MNFSEMKKKTKRLSQVIMLVIALSCMGFALISTHQLNESIDLGNRKIVLNYGNQVAARVHDFFERVDISLASLSREIIAEEDESMEAQKVHLEDYQDIWTMDATGLLYEDGTGCLSDGSEAVFENKISLQDVLSYSEKLNISRQDINGQDMLVLAKPCRKQVEGRAVNGIFAAVKIERLERLLGDYGYSSDSFLVLTQSNGDNIWKQTDASTEEPGNCFEELEQQSINQRDSILQMQTRMSVAMDGTICYTRDGQDYYMAYVPLNVNYWYLLLSVRSDSIDLTELARQHYIISLLLMGIIFALGIVSIIYLFQRNRSISGYNMQLQIANKANQANKAKQEFLAKVSHDIRTPLNGMMGMVSLAKEEYADKAKCMECLDKATISARYLLELLNDVLDMSQIESGKQKIVEGTVDMKELLKETGAIMETSAEEKGLSFELKDSALKHRYFKGDELRIKQILMNLSTNAVKYTPSGGMVCLEAEEIQQKGHTKLIFKVRDNGEGIAEDKMESIFKPFEQVSQKRQGGVGLGLSIVKSFVELMGGQIAVESQIGVGSTFTVTLPLQIVDQPEAGQEEVFSDNLDGVSILLAEDNKVNSEIAVFMLEKRGAKVKHVWDGEAVLEEFKQAPQGTYQVILMDIQMPKMNGLVATQEIRKLDRPDAATIPILSMTANAFHEQKEEMRQAGMNDFLYKPIDVKTVCSCINKWIKED